SIHSFRQLSRAIYCLRNPICKNQLNVAPMHSLVSRRTCLLLTPLHEPFEREELRQPQVVVHLGRVAVAVLGALPEFTAVHAAGEHGAVLLRLMAEDGRLLALQVARAERHDPFNFVRLPLFPGAAIEPDLEVLALGADAADGIEDRVGADTMCAV